MFYVHRSGRRRARNAVYTPSRRVGWSRPALLLGLVALSAALGELAPEGAQSLAVAQPQAVQNPYTPAEQPVQYQGVPGGQPQMQIPPGSAAQPTGPGGQSGRQDPLEEPLRLVAAAKQMYAQVQSYRCVLISQERINRDLKPENVMELTYRKNPLSIYMRWIGPKDKVGQEVCYVQGKNQNKLRVLPKGGMSGLLGWTSFDIDSPTVKQNSRHIITETGFANIIDQCEKHWTRERTMGKTAASVAEYEYNKRRCIRVEATHTAYDPSFYSYRFVVFFDKETRLPVRMESYDWPRAGSPQGGELLECFSFVNVTDINANCPETTFMH